MRRKTFTLLALAVALLGGACSSKSNDNPTVGAGQTSATTAAAGTATTAASGGSATTATSATAATGLSGTWSGTYQQTSPIADSGTDSGTFTLNWQQSGSNVTGGISIPGACSNCPISATVNGSTVSFGVVALGAITYTGTVSGNSMSGTYATPDSSTKGTWKASKTG
ncbi:MAG: hypothetical protein LC792_29100 [Actinobacteria bacterium]|nr:hypothetical protein [Actinomycetota bacterium]